MAPVHWRIARAAVFKIALGALGEMAFDEAYGFAHVADGLGLLGSQPSLQLVRGHVDEAFEGMANVGGVVFENLGVGEIGHAGRTRGREGAFRFKRAISIISPTP